MELPADPSPPSGAELERLEKEQALGETENLGCPRFETANAIKTGVSCGSDKIQSETATPGGPAKALTASTPGGPIEALTATAPGGAETIQTQKGKT
jgi:hypothetical protein